MKIFMIRIQVFTFNEDIQIYKLWSSQEPHGCGLRFRYNRNVLNLHMILRNLSFLYLFLSYIFSYRRQKENDLKQENELTISSV